MSVVRRCGAGAVVAGLVLLGGPAWAQEDPCAPGPDGSVPQMCQSGPASATPTVGMQPDDPCAGSRPVESGDGVVTDEGGQGSPPEEPLADPQPEPVDPAQTEPGPGDPGPGADGADGIVCVLAVPVAAPGEASGGGQAAAREDAVASQLPRTGPYDRLLGLLAAGAALLLLGAGAAAAGRRPQV